MLSGRNLREGGTMSLGKRINNNKDNMQLNSESDKTQNDNAVKGNAVSQSINMFCAENPKYKFSDIILNQKTYDSVQDVLAIYEKHKVIFDEWGLAATHKQENRVGINLYGVPGTGKTMVAHAIAEQLKRKILTVDYSQIESKYVGETAKNLVSMFEYAKQSNAVIFFDEADALLSKRVTDMSNSTDVSVNQTRSVLLILINDYNDIILFATNFIKNYDPAFMRRILAHIKFDYPDEANRIKLWNLYIPETLPTDADIACLSSKYSNVSGSDISNAVFTASLRAARLNEKYVKHTYFEDAIEQIIKSKEDNNDIVISKNTVSKDYVKSQFGGVLPK